MRLAMKFGVSLQGTTPLPRRRSQKAETKSITSMRGVEERDQLDQVHVARRVEEVGAQEVLAEAYGKSFGDFMKRDAAGVGGDDGGGLAEELDFFPEVALDG